MANPPRKKGTAGETELLRMFEAKNWVGYRRQAGSRYDLEIPGGSPPMRTLAIRPDHGQWLFVLDFDTLTELMEGTSFRTLQVEVKRRKTSALHTMWNKEMDWDA